MMEEQKQTETRKIQPSGLKIRKVSVFIAGISFLLFILVLLSVGSVRLQFSELTSNTQEYINLQKSVMSMESASSYLTENVRRFVVTGKTECISNYYEELNVLRRRDYANALLQAQSNEEAYRHLNNAMAMSKELEITETYAMRLYLHAKGVDSSNDRSLRDIFKVSLSEEDMELPKEEQIQRAQYLVFDDSYERQRTLIEEEISLSADALVNGASLNTETTSRRFKTLLVLQHILIFVIVGMIGVTLYIIWKLVLNPQDEILKRIRKRETLPIEGSYELQYIACTYNEVFEENLSIRDSLAKEASHDALTGLYNRRKFESICSYSSDYSLVLIDVDHFKSFNDQYGHAVGDKVLQKVSNVISKNMRKEDAVCRIGGDEFAVILQHVNSDQRETVLERFDTIREKLKNPEDALPPITISIGVAFHDRSNGSENIMHDADVALYRCKDAGRDGYVVFA